MRFRYAYRSTFFRSFHRLLHVNINTCHAYHYLLELSEKRESEYQFILLKYPY